VKQLQENFTDEAVRPGIVHRLDKDTSGVIVAAKDPEALHYLAAQFARKKVRKVYLAVVKGHVEKPRGEISHPIARDPHNRKRFTWKRQDGKTALTRYRVLRYLHDATLVELSPSTGRTHQLRVHMASLGHPILGDPVYGRNSGPGDFTLLLHARKILIRLPGEEDFGLYRALLPLHFKRALLELRR
jgi:23S rRNA pseudouridine1911/1915/1917 synthase